MFTLLPSYIKIMNSLLTAAWNGTHLASICSQLLLNLVIHIIIVFLYKTNIYIFFRKEKGFDSNNSFASIRGTWTFTTTRGYSSSISFVLFFLLLYFASFFFFFDLYSALLRIVKIASFQKGQQRQTKPLRIGLQNSLEIHIFL